MDKQYQGSKKKARKKNFLNREAKKVAEINRWMKFNQGMSFEDAAKAMGIPLGRGEK